MDDHLSNKAAQDATAKSAASEELLKRAESLQSELEQFANHLTEIYDGYLPTYMYTSFASELRAEVSCQKAVRSTDPLASHRVQSTNLPFLEPVWEMAKRSRDIVRLRCPLSAGPFQKQILAPGTRIVRSQGESQPSRRLGSFIIDVIADGGSSWYKISSMTNKRLLFDLAKEAVYFGDSDDDDDDEDDAQTIDIPLLKLARSLANTAKGHRIQTKTPVAFLVLPRIREREHPDIDKVLEACRQLGVRLLCSDDLSPAPPLSDSILHAMAPSPKANFSDVLNIDTSLLVALASDFSHTNVTKQPWFSHSHNDHADLENEQSMLSLVYPMLGNHKLVCTREASDAFFHIADTLATDAEKARAHLILCRSGIEKSQEQRVKELKLLSIHEIPLCLQLPISIVDMNENGCQDRFTDPIKKTLKSMLNPGRSVFSYGWASERTTLTCNSVVIKQLEKDLEQLSTLDLPWPSIWAFTTSRPFVGIPKDTRKRVRKHIGDCSVTCTCGVDEIYGRLGNVTIV
ncbi:hypothetical protein F4820DRAFT_324158 [Hypoxylon rubiginosum]|uniref:Uncharacterized protein n=1 Tax=Hypoxylon rubiginosum TaxID=110542 RepID=A0ACB9YZG5_9PEZI|nr:hypothetical protein F4820DRAFT_324158 [Hypoxylon rubiginosum]